MQLTDLLRAETNRLMRSYDRRPSELRRLYVTLKENQHYRKPAYANKLGKRNFEWLVDLEAYGDERGWDKEVER